MAEYIERELVLKTIRDNFCTYFPNVLDVVRRIPTADVQPVKHSHWFYPFSELDVNRCWECGFHVQDKINNVREMFHYCPHCGAKMDGDTNG